MKENKMQAMDDAARPERLAWYWDLVQEMTGCVPQLGQTTKPVLIDGMYWQVVHAVASVPAFVSSAGFGHEAVRACGETEEEALRALCERLHALTWGEQEVFVLPGVEEDALQMAGVV